MNYYRKFINIFLLIYCFSPFLMAQKAIPPSSLYKNIKFEKPTIYEYDFKEDIQQLIKEDDGNVKFDIPLRIAVGEEMKLDINAGNLKKTQLGSGDKIWQYTINSEKTNGIILTFQRFYIPQGDKLYIYTADKKQVAVYTNESNPNGGVYATEAFYAKGITLEYVESPDRTDTEQLIISNIACVYRSASSLTCYINVGCSEGKNWDLQKNGVVGLSIKMGAGWYVCSGSLVNNVRQDGTPYILTANHCIKDYDSETFPTMVFSFFKESTNAEADCTEEVYTSTSTKTLTGATLIAVSPVNGASDGSLLKLTSPIPTDWYVYYNGWDATGNVPQKGVGIHHPAGMIKKISTYKAPLTSVGNLAVDTYTTGSNADWLVAWTATENGFSPVYGGSSGSPLFNENGLIVGTLTGGNSSCEAPSLPAIYGKFSYHWDQYSDQDQHFKKYLDPDNTGVTTLEGYDPHAYIFESAPEAISATDITPIGFTARWNNVDQNIESYLLDVYTKNDQGEVEFLDGFKQKNIGNVLSYAITGLKYETQYFYAVRGQVRHSISEVSNEIAVTTSQATFNYMYPIATEATNISDNSFVANWQSLPGAISYYLNLYKEKEIINRSDSINFDNQQISDGWETTSTTYTSTKNQFGVSAPALRLGDGQYIQSPVYDQPIKEFEFWYRGLLTDGDNKLLIYILKENEWILAKTITPLISSTEGSLVSVLYDEIPDAKAIKILHQKSAGNVAIDDIKIIYANLPASEKIFEDKDTQNELLYTINGLDSHTNYSYTVRGHNGSVYSMESNKIYLLTTGSNPIISSTIDIVNIFVDNENINIYTTAPINDNIVLFNMTGQPIVSKKIDANPVQISRRDLTSGVYVLKIGTKIYKLILN
ncbi:MAG: fibronectin type III domain-containing protein [Dysgonomonas sp.]